MSTKPIETYCGELIMHLMEGLKDRLHAHFRNENPDRRLKMNFTAMGAESVIEYKGQFYRITVEALN